jgi:hypothetical protein
MALCGSLERQYEHTYNGYNQIKEELSFSFL